MSESGDILDFDDMNFDDFLKNREDDDDETEELDQMLKDEGLNDSKDISPESIANDISTSVETEKVAIQITPKDVEKGKETKSKKRNRFVIEFPPPKQNEINEIRKEDKNMERSLLLFIQGKLVDVVKKKKESKVEDEEKEIKKNIITNNHTEIIARKLESINKNLLEKYEGQVVPKPDMKKLEEYYRNYEKNKSFFEINKPIQNEIILLEFIHQHLNEKFYKFVMKCNKYRKQRDLLKKMVKDRDNEISRLKRRENLVVRYERRLKELDKDFVPGKTKDDKKESKTSIFSFFGV